MKIIGIDPGLTGAIALLVDAKPASVWDMPVYDGSASGLEIGEILTEAEPDFVIIEWVQPMPKNGVIASFSLGKNYGVVLGVATALRHPVIKLRPMEWKKANGLVKKPKSASRGLAMELWPDAAPLFKRVKDDGRAEACLIARAGSARIVHEINGAFND